MNLGKEERIASARVPSQPNLCPHIEAKNITATDNENRSSSLNEGEVKKKKVLDGNQQWYLLGVALPTSNCSFQRIQQFQRTAYASIRPSPGIYIQKTFLILTHSGYLEMYKGYLSPICTDVSKITGEPSFYLIRPKVHLQFVWNERMAGIACSSLVKIILLLLVT